VNKGFIASGGNGSVTNSKDIPDATYYVPAEAFLIAGGIIGGGLFLFAKIVMVKYRKIRLKGLTQ
jgi:hypothetical protein